MQYVRYIKFNMLLKLVKLYKINSSGGALEWIWKAKKLWSGNIILK